MLSICARRLIITCRLSPSPWNGGGCGSWADIKPAAQVAKRGQRLRAYWGLGLPALSRFCENRNHHWGRPQGRADSH